MIHKIEPGQWLGAVATKYGLPHWSTLWDHPANAALRELRGSPNLLMAGDEVHVPEPGERPGLEVQTNRRVVFRARPAADRIRIRVGGLAPLVAALGPIPYTLEIGGSKTEGKVEDASGIIEGELPLDAAEAKLTLMETEVYEFKVGGLGPAHEAKGGHARLINLGFPRRSSGTSGDDGGGPNGGGGAEGATDPLVESVSSFQREEGLDQTGALDGGTVRRLVEVYGG